MSFISQWSGAQIDEAIGVIRESGVSHNDLSVLRGVDSGIVSSSKAVVVNSDKNIGTFNRVTSTSFRSSYLEIQNRSENPSSSPLSGYRFLFYKDGQLYMKNSDGDVSKVGAGKEIEFEFESETSVVCEHGFGVRYPLVDVIGSDNKTLEGQVYYQDKDTVVVTFNSSRSGRVFVRSI